MDQGQGVTEQATGFRPFRVAKRVVESEIITSFYLEPVDGLPLAPFKPGQFLTFRLPVGPENQSILRTYSLSNGVGDGYYRISVKREAAPAAGLPQGRGSCYLHDSVATGDVIQVAPPRGDFFLDTDSSRPVVLLSGGVGLTPMVSMLHHLSKGGERRVFFIHACENGRVHALGDEVRQLATRRPGIHTHFIYRQPGEDDRKRDCFDSEGLISRALLQQLLAIDDYEFYLCGPPPFMTAIYALLRDLGVASSRIAYEFFGPATVLEAKAATGTSASSPIAAGDSAEMANTVPPAAGVATVTFTRSGRQGIWDEAAQNLLAFAETQDLSPTFSCRAGICGSCTTALISGEVSYTDEPLDPPESGQILLCICKPVGEIELDL